MHITQITHMMHCITGQNDVVKCGTGYHKHGCQDSRPTIGSGTVNIYVLRAAFSHGFQHLR